MKNIYDVIIIGGGVVGSAIARELSRYQLKIAVLEKNLDVCCETSGRNSAVIHGGFAYDTGSLKAICCVEGNREFDHLAKELDFRFVRCGKVLVGNTPEDMQSLQRTMQQGIANGVQGLRIIDKEELHQLVPKVVGEFAMYSPSSGIVDPFGYTIALAENAFENGAAFFLGHEVTNICRENDVYKIDTPQSTFFSRWVINSAGLGCAKISDMLGFEHYEVIGSKGNYIILDKRTGPWLPMPVYPVPSNTYMGVHVTNTVDGNVIVGPDAQTVTDFSYYGVSKDQIDFLMESASKLWPCIYKQDFIRNYAGILPKWVDKNGKIQDFKIEMNEKAAPHAINLIGIESPGLTAAVPIARRVVSMIADHEKCLPKSDFNPIRRAAIRFAEQNEEEQARLIRENPDYGEIICRCEKISKAEILKAIHNPLGVCTLTGIKYRTRSMMGRCQGGYCQTRIVELIRQELGKKENEILYSRPGSTLFTQPVRKEV